MALTLPSPQSLLGQSVELKILDKLFLSDYFWHVKHGYLYMTLHYDKYGRDYYQRNKEKVAKRIKKNKTRWKEEWKAFKSSLSCTQCGESHPAILDFHHPKKEEKEGAVHQFIKQDRYKKAFEEAAKCVVLCANCHRKHHYDERQKEKGAEAPFSYTTQAPAEPNIPSGSDQPNE